MSEFKPTGGGVYSQIKGDTSPSFKLTKDSFEKFIADLKNDMSIKRPRIMHCSGSVAKQFFSGMEDLDDNESYMIEY